ncbi:MAG: chitobiase/beta-hexosaminidase C-terminal domain-containing protein [Patescibacteria group bacterium]|nr:chitobiase/beta-hexosaminidase C-terminal domain-containing protein [Patescibacteria group bacterium]
MSKKLSFLFIIFLFLIACFFTVGFSTKTASARESNVWMSVGLGVDASVNKMVVYNNELYVGGDFTTAGGQTAGHIAKWNGLNWSSVGLGVNQSPYSMVVYNNELYVTNIHRAGGIDTNGIAIWNGLSWRDAGFDLIMTPSELAVYNNELYVGGNYSDGSFIDGYVAKLNGVEWNYIRTISNSPIYLLKSLGDKLYLGINCEGKSYIDVWDGMQWSSLGSEVISDVPNDSMITYLNDIEIYNGEIIVSIRNDYYGTLKWNGSEWVSLGSAIVKGRTLAVYNNELYVGGDFTGYAGGIINNNYITKWNGNSWLKVGNNLEQAVNDLEVYADELYVGHTVGISKLFIDSKPPVTNVNPAGGIYYSSQDVVLNSVDDDSQVSGTYYTTDGSTPTVFSSRYISPINIISDTTLKFFSVDILGNIETTKTETYTILPQPQSPDQPVLPQQPSEHIINSDISFVSIPMEWLTKKWYTLNWNKYLRYPSNWQNVSQKALRKEWILTSNLYKARKPYKIKATFKYSQKQVRRLKKANPLVSERNLRLKFRTDKSKWQLVKNGWVESKIVQNRKENTFTVKYFTKFPEKKYYFAIGLK